MAWREELATDLPDPRPADPPTLRDDILDELADHLACAADRERLQGGDETEIAARVRHRFGHPARIALQLWLDAMKERLMAQRITTVAAIILALAAVVVCGLLWSSVRETRQSLTAALEQNREQALRNAETNAALLARFEELSKSADQMSSFAMEWNPVRVKLVKGENGTAPAVGYSATLTGGSYEKGLTRQADETGLIDFGYVQPGQYSLSVITPWGADMPTSLPLQVNPGTKIDRTIACPAEEIVPAEVRLEIEWPEDLPEEVDAAVITVSHPVQPFGDNHWLLARNSNEMSFVIERDGTVTQTNLPRRSTSPLFDRTLFDRGARQADRPSLSDLFESAGIKRIELNGDSPQRSRPAGWRTGRYSLSRMALVWPDILHSRAVQRSELISERALTFLARSPLAGLVSLATANQPTDEGELPIQAPQPFMPMAGQTNVWRLKVPPAMVEQARDRVSSFNSWSERQQQPVEAPQPAPN